MGQVLVKFLGKSQARVQHLLRALSAQVDREMNHLQLDISTQVLLVELMGPHISPRIREGASIVTTTDEGRDRIRALIQALSGSIDGAAQAELIRLRTLPQLKAWWMQLDSAIFENTRLTRAAYFTHASPQAVALMLANRAPANPSDLQALLVDHFRELEKEIRGSDANILDQFWTDGRTGGHRNPQIENVCRDRLKPLLHNRLRPLNVQLDKEGYAAGDKRMDLRVSLSTNGRRRTVPIEIKKDSHENVWTAWRDQLDLKYLNDPNSGGYGIYLVLWFGQKATKLDSVRPTSADQMKSLLLEKIPAADRTRIAVVVMDLSNSNSANQ